MRKKYGLEADFPNSSENFLMIVYVQPFSLTFHLLSYLVGKQVRLMEFQIFIIGPAYTQSFNHTGMAHSVIH